MASASRKEFEMAFKLSAQVNGSYNSAFKGAQSTLSSLQKEITGLNRVQSDVSAYQKQQGAVEGTRKKLEVLQRQYDNIQKEMKETEGSSSSLESSLASKQQQIDKAAVSLGQQEARLGQMGAALQQAGVDTGNLAAESQRLETEMQGLKGRQEEAAEAARTFGTEAAGAMEAISSALAAAGAAAALKEIADAYMECISVAGAYEETMSTVEALSGAGANEMGQLSAEAKRLGAETQFTAQESAEAMTYMAMAGWETTDMLQGMDGVIQLAAASGEDLAMVSDIVTDNLTAFGMSAADTAHFSDVLAAAATSSNTSVSIMGETFKQSASIAGALGYSVDDVAVAVGLMANSGIKGSIAGTALKNTFNGLLEGATLTGRALGEYEFTALKADGTMKSFSETIDELRTCFSDMSEAEKVNNAMLLAGQRGYNGLLAVINATDSDFASLTQNIHNCAGAASRMASVKLDNMNGQLKLAQSAWEGVTIAVGEQFTGAMGKAYAIAAEVFGGLKEFVEEHPAIVAAVTAFTAVVGTAVAGLTAYAAVVKVIKLLDVATLFTGPTGAILAAVGAVAALTAGIAAMATEASNGIPTVGELTEAVKGMEEAMDEATAGYEESSSSMAATASVAESYIDRLDRIKAETRGNVEGNQEYHNILELLARTIPELASSIDLETDSIEGGTEALRRHTEAWKQDAEQQARQEYLNSLYDDYSAVMAESAENSIKLTQAQRKEEAASEKRQTALARMNKLLREAEEAERQHYEATGEYALAGGKLAGEYYALEEAVRGYESEISEARQEQENLVKAIGEDEEAVSAAKATIEEAEAAVEEMTAAEREASEAAALAAEQQEAVAGAIGDTQACVDELVESYHEAFGAAMESLSGQYSLWDEAAKVAAMSVSDINGAMESQVSYWQNYNANLEALSARTGEIAGLSDVIAGFADGSEESVNAIAGMASASDSDLQEMVANWQSLQAEQVEAARSIADLRTGFTQEMDSLAQELATDIDGMDLGPEAEAAGRATIQGFIDGAKDMEAQVQSAYARIAQAANAALNSQSNAGVAGIGSVGSTHKYASGTVSAEPGFAEVGEDGPEIVFLNGGEKILTAAETARAKSRLMPYMDSMGAAPPQAQGNGAALPMQALPPSQPTASIVINSSPTIYIDGSRPGDLEEKLAEYNRQLAGMVEDILYKRRDTERRSAYA